MENLNLSRAEQQQNETESLLLLDHFVSQPLTGHRDDLKNLGFASVQLLGDKVSSSQGSALKNIGNLIIEQELSDQIKKGYVLPKFLPSVEK
jgi:hypothetical protein